jgi:ATP-dependent Clp protease ATP-binding subunit ClpB
MRPIVDIQLRDLQRRMVARRLDLVVTDNARDWLAVRGYDEAFGARPLKRLIQREVGDTLATALLAGSFGEGETVTVDVVDDHIVLA